jgi:ferredoxin
LPACLSTISKAGWFELGLKTEIELHREECQKCLMSTTLSHIEFDIGTAVEWVKASGKEAKVSFIYEDVNGTTKRDLRALETGLRMTSRRELFMSLIEHGRRELIKKVDEIASLTSVTEKSNRMRTTNYLPEWKQRLAKVYPKNQTNVSTPAYWPTIKIDDTCINCEMCSKFCPVGALETKVEHGTITYYFTNGLCIDCGICQLFCPNQAINSEMDRIENPFATISIYSKDANLCRVCKKPTSDHSNHLCYMCEHDDINNHQLVKSCKEMFFSI